MGESTVPLILRLQVLTNSGTTLARSYHWVLLSQHLTMSLTQKLRTVVTRRCCFIEFSRLLQTFNTREYIARATMHLLGDVRSEFFTGRIQTNPALCLLNFLILGDDLVCIIALKLSLILFMNSERFSKIQG